MSREDSEYVDTVFYRITKGKPQPMAEVWRAAIQSTLDAALNRLSDRIGNDDSLYPLLVNEYELTLVDGEADVVELDPPLLMSYGPRKHWRVEMEGIRFPLKYLPHRGDLDNPPPCPDYYYYTIFNGKLVVRDYRNLVPPETVVRFFSNCAAPLSHPAYEGELFDNLIDVGVALVLESGNLNEVVRQAEMDEYDDAPKSAA